MDMLFKKVMKEFFPATEIPFWKTWLLKWAFGTKILSRLMRDDNLLNNRGTKWVDYVIEFFQVRCETPHEDFLNIPLHGPAIVISNHPTVMDGPALIHTVSQVRKDIKIVANHILPLLFPQVSELTIGIENMAGKMSHKKFREMNGHLKKGGVLIICPAGKLASWSLSGLKEPDWNPGFIQLAIRNDAALVPVHITGTNSARYYFTAKVWRQLSNIMIIREAQRHRGKILKLKIGRQIALSTFTQYGKDLSLAAKACSKHLNSIGSNGPEILETLPLQTHVEDRNQLVEAMKACEILKTYKDDKHLLLYRCENGDHSPIIDELGHLRKACYRAIGVGADKIKDNDIFDESYFHIILWDSFAREIMGSYRLVPVGEQLVKYGLSGLYSHTLFQYHDDANCYLEKSIEIGRGFIQKKYQKSGVLDYLWRGIFDFTKKYPDYKYFLGVLTIPGSYPENVQSLIINFYIKYFSTIEPFCTPIAPLPLVSQTKPDSLSTDSFKNDWLELNRLLKEKGYELPWPFKQTAKWFAPGGSALISFTKDESFNSIAGLNLSTIEKLKDAYCKHYLTDS